MRNVLAAAFLTALAVTLVHPAHSQPTRNREDFTEVRQFLQRIPGPSTGGDTVWIGHVTSGGQLPFRVGRGPHRPGLSPDGLWDFDSFNGGALDSMQGWVPIVRPNDRTAGTIPDYWRPWMALDYGNRMNAAPRQGRTIGIVSAWHVDRGAAVPDAATPGASPTWSALSGSASAWCGLRAGDDVAYLDDPARGGTGNALNGEVLQGLAWDGLDPTAKNFPGYGDQWDQMLYRDVRVANGGSLTVSFEYQTWMSTGLDNSADRCTGWFDRDPLAVQQGGSGPAASNFISASAYPGTPARSGPVDSFIVYVGVPADPQVCMHSDGLPRPIYDLKRRWFSEVIAIDKPYVHILSTSGQDSAFKASPYSTTAPNGVLQPMLDSQGAADHGGVIRVVFRVKTNKDLSDETGTGGPFSSRTLGAVRIDDVAIAGCTPAFTTSGFETPSEINNTIEASDFAAPGPPVSTGYALHQWHGTGKSPGLLTHPHPLSGGEISPGNWYDLLNYHDLCGASNSPIRQCNINNVVISTGDHDRAEAAGGPIGEFGEETRQGMMSPTINLVTPATGQNNCGLTAANVNTTDDWLLAYDIYAGIFDAPNLGNVWQWGVFSYPATQANGAKTWGDLCLPSYVLSSAQQVCRQDVVPLKTDGLIHTSNANGVPDSLRLYLGREQRCISWGVTVACSPTDGHYLDNISLGFPSNRPGATALGTVSADLGQWINDTFPINEDPGLPGTAAFDTCAALIKTGVNIAPTTGNAQRFDVPGDTTVVVADGDGIRVDLVFRIRPGPGNYVVAGNRASGVRRVPTSTTVVTPGDGSFWGEYLLSPGAFSKGTHAGGWNPNTWNSARCDTAELNLFPVNGRQGNLAGLAPGRWSSTYHESDPKFATLGILKNRCFLVDTALNRPIDNTNITCSSEPNWITDPDYAPRAGYDGNRQTREFTKILPDGLLTPGSHVEYFFRKSRIATPSTFAMVPDTEYIAPQPAEGPSYDGHRWQEFGVLPDLWKDPTYGGPGLACVLYVDAADRRGNERVWAGVSDSAGYGNNARNNGWRNITGVDYWGIPVGPDPTIAVWEHDLYPTTLWDMYGVKGAETAGGAAGSLGSRLSPRTGMGLMTGMESKQGPTPGMLRAYYKAIFLFSGDLSSGGLGPAADRSQNDIGIIQDFLSTDANPSSPRSILTMGSGFVEGEEGKSTSHETFLGQYLGARLRAPSYRLLAGATNPGAWFRLWTNPYLPDLPCLRNDCLNSEDVLDKSTDLPETVVGAVYNPIGAQWPYIAGTIKPATPERPWQAIVDGWDLADMYGWPGTNPGGRWRYFSTQFYPQCPGFQFIGSGISPYVSVDTTSAPRDFAALFNNPLSSGTATIEFGLSAPDRVEAKVYDIAGRLVRTLATREFTSGRHTLTWDGTDDSGQRLAHGVYFTTVRYVRGGFHATKKLTILR